MMALRSSTLPKGTQSQNDFRFQAAGVYRKLET